MNRKCKSCGTDVPNEAKFCPLCGSSDFIVSDSELREDENCNTALNRSGYDQNQYGYINSENQSYQPFYPQSKPRKNKWPVIVGIVAAVLVGLAAFGISFEKSLKNQGYGFYDDTEKTDKYDSASASSNGSDTAEYSYTKGTFDGSVYINNWADIKFVLPEGFVNADSDIYAASENETTECGVYFISEESMSFIYISYEKLPSFPVYNENEYLDAAMNNLKSITEITYKVPDSYSAAEIAGHSYTKAECEFNNGYSDFAYTIYVRKLDNYIICISSVSINAESNDALVKNITTVN